jgi:outer membrane lipoprotein carrier protein
MELLDLFGNTTVLRVTAIKRNPTLPPGLFKFTPPKGADVLSE